MNEFRFAPWSDEEVAILNHIQKNPSLHPYRCSCGEPLTPTTMGWICKRCPDVKQDFCLKSTLHSDAVTMQALNHVHSVMR